MRLGQRRTTSLVPAWAFWLAAGALLAVTVLLRVPYLEAAADLLDSDNAIAGLMGLHIAQGRHYPLYFYGQGYLGAAETYLAAGLFALFGPSAPVLSLSGLIPFVFFAALSAALVRKLAGPLPALAGLGLMALCPPYMAWFFASAWGGYSLVLVLGLAWVWLWLRLTSKPAGTQGQGKILAALAAVLGLGLWTHTLVLFWLAPCLVLSCLALAGGLRRAWLTSQEPAGPVWLKRLGQGLGLLGLAYLTYALVITLAGLSLDWELGGMRLVKTSPQAAGGLDLVRSGLVLALAGGLLFWQRLGLGGLWRALKSEPAHLGALAAAAGGVVLWRLIHLAFVFSPEYDFGHYVPPLRLATLKEMTVRLNWLGQWFVPQVFGLAGPWGRGGLSWLLAGLTAAALSLIGGQAWLAARRGQWAEWLAQNRLIFCCGLSTASLVAALVLTTAAPTPKAERYLALSLAWWPWLMVWLGGWLRAKFRPAGWAWWLGLALILGWSALASLAAGPVGKSATWTATSGQPSYGRVIRTLEREGVNHAEADYWLAYVLDFLSQESLIVSPGPDFAQSLVRYPPYARQVEQASRRAYIFRARLDDKARTAIRARLKAKGKSFKELKIANYSFLIVPAPD
ncbi:MAG: hypothetical protein JRJ59_06795 [Deltaproteobacteria bacterium]|nr:hypothetical protein [Deltaproteobacteria bacterium]